VSFTKLDEEPPEMISFIVIFVASCVSEYYLDEAVLQDEGADSSNNSGDLPNFNFCDFAEFTLPIDAESQSSWSAFCPLIIREGSPYGEVGESVQECEASLTATGDRMMASAQEMLLENSLQLIALLLSCDLDTTVFIELERNDTEIMIEDDTGIVNEPALEENLKIWLTIGHHRDDYPDFESNGMPEGFPLNNFYLSAYQSQAIDEGIKAKEIQISNSVVAGNSLPTSELTNEISYIHDGVGECLDVNDLAPYKSGHGDYTIETVGFILPNWFEQTLQGVTDFCRFDQEMRGIQRCVGEL